MSRIGIFFILVLFVYAASITFAKSENGNNGSQGQGMSASAEKEVKAENKGPEKNEKEKTESTGSGAVSPAANRGQAKAALTPSATCAPEGQWKNHGDYVRCVAQLHQGGQAVSEAARSDVGKKQATASASLSPAPSSTASASISPLPSSATPSASFTPEATETGTVTAQVQKLFGGIKGFFKKLQSLFIF